MTWLVVAQTLLSVRFSPLACPTIAPLATLRASCAEDGPSVARLL